MALIEWKEEYSLGLPEIDEEHKELIDLINRLYDSLTGSGTKEDVEEYLGEIYAAISGHFALEEDIMRRMDYWEYAGHKADHERLLDVLLDLIDVYSYSEELDKEQFAAELDDWFTNHFKTFDARFHHALPH